MDGHRLDAVARMLAAGRSRRAVLGALGVSLLGGRALAQSSAGTPEAGGTPVAATPIAASPPLVDAADLKQAAAGLPADPVDAAIALVGKIFDGDEATAQAAAGELLRRAGIGLVSTDGPVIGWPDRLVVANSPFYVDSLRDLAQGVRTGLSYTAEHFAALLSVFGIGIAGKPLTPDQLFTLLASWGKGESDPVESRVAGAAVRALAGSRQQVFVKGANEVSFDLLQGTLLILHWTAREAARTAPSAEDENLAYRPLASEKPPAGPCDFWQNGLGTFAGGPDKAGMKKAIQQMGDHAYGKEFGEGMENIDNVEDVLSVLLLLLGANIDINDDHGGQTKFKHDPSDTGKHVKVTAIGSFDPAIAAKYIACYNLAGVELPPAGRLKDGFKMRWKLDQAEGTMANDPNAAVPPMAGSPQGKYLATVHADSNKLQDGEALTKANGGVSTLTLKPPVEESDKGVERKGSATVIAYLDKTDLPLKAGDLIGLAVPGMGGVRGAVISILLAAVTKAGLPSKSDTITITYHGNDIYTSKPQFSFNTGGAIDAGSITADLCTCEGVKGTWKGTSTMNVDPQAMIQLVGRIFGKNFTTGKASNPKVQFDGESDHKPTILNAAGKVKVQATLEIDRTMKKDEHVDGPVGFASLFMNGYDLAALSAEIPGSYSGGLAPIVGVEDDSRCEERKYYYDET